MDTDLRPYRVILVTNTGFSRTEWFRDSLPPYWRVPVPAKFDGIPSEAIAPHVPMPKIIEFRLVHRAEGVAIYVED
jgi:hypothetical protein